MNRDEKRDAALEALLNINRMWLAGRVEALEEFVHADVVTILPDFAGRVNGREDFLAGSAISLPTLESIGSTITIMRLI